MNEIDLNEEPVLLSASKVARLLQISTRTLWRLLAAERVNDFETLAVRI